MIKTELREKWKGLLGEAFAAAALLLCMQLVAQATPAAVWLVVVVFFLAAGLAASSVFLTRSRFSHVFVEIVLLVVSLQSATNLYINSPAVWSVWIWCCLLTILLIFAYHVLENAALIFKIQVEFLLFLLIAALSVPVVKNLLSPTQIMNASSMDGTLNIVNTYGLFGAVAQSVHSAWSNYEFKCKPGDPYRSPCFLSPYHYRLDWLMNTPSVTKLLARNPFKRSGPPTALRVVKVKYFFSSSSRIFGGGPWWVVDADNAEMFTLPTEVPEAVEHLQEMRELFYRRRVTIRQQQLQRQEDERQRLEKEAFEARRKAAAAEEKKREAAAAALAKAEKERLAAAARKRQREKREQVAVAAKIRAAGLGGVPLAVQKERPAEVQNREEEAKEAEKTQKEQETARKASEKQEQRYREEVKQHEEEAAQHLAGLVQPSKLPESKEGAEEAGSRVPVPEAVEMTQPEVARQKLRPQQQREETSKAPASGTANAEKASSSTEAVHEDDGGVPLHAAPLFSRRRFKLLRY
ncbi:UNVERIFIED_CONTAM: hypothetical protein H355_005473 [Colinus virginianus]|nr:hypothetical protein H355_005473 [Colinus virginianus]